MPHTSIKRRYAMNLDLQADSFDDLLNALKNLQLELLIAKDRGSTNFEAPYKAVSGGVHSGYSLEIYFDPEMTHEKYFEQIDEFLSDNP